MKDREIIRLSEELKAMIALKEKHGKNKKDKQDEVSGRQRVKDCLALSRSDVPSPASFRR